MSLICFVITMVLWVSLFLYMRQRISALEDRVALLSKLTTAVAGVTRTLSEPENIVVENENENDTDSDSDESDESDESEPQETSVSVPVHLLMDEFPRMAQSMTCEDHALKCVMLEEPLLNLVLPESFRATELESISAIEIEEVDTELPKRKVSSDDVKTLSVELNYDSLSVKELKDKVAEMNGPKLKTKKELLEFLKNKL